MKLLRGDWIAIGVVLLLALCSFLLFPTGQGPDGASAVVTREGEMLKEISLQRDGEYAIEEHYILTVKDGKIFVTESDCRGNDCVKTGMISKPGQLIVCLPKKLEIRVTSSVAVEDDDVDLVVK